MEVGKKIFGRSVARDPKDRKVREKERRARGDHPLALPHLTVADLDSEEKVPKGLTAETVEAPGSQGPRPADAHITVSLLTSKAISQAGCTRTS